MPRWLNEGVAMYLSREWDFTRVTTITQAVLTDSLIPLSQLAAVKVVSGPSMIRDEDGRLSGYVYVDVAGRDIGSYVRDAKDAVLRQVCAGLAFIGVDGISLKYGCTTPSNVEADIGQLMVERTRGSVVIVADHSKCGCVSTAFVAPLDAIHTLVTDTGTPPEFRSALEARGVRVIAV